jgi:ankyrin repeat protein
MIFAHAKDYDWSQTNDLGHSGLYLSAAAGHRTTVQRLLQHQIDVNTFCGRLGHPLHAACFRGHASIVELLLDHGADPKLGPKSALEYAILADHENIALLLLDGKFVVANQAEYDSVLQQAAEAGFADVIQFLQKEYASLYGDLGSSRCRALEVAIFRGHTGVVERYMQRLSDTRTGLPEDAIATASLGGQDTMISLLVDKGLDLNKEGILGTPLRSASIMCHESTVRLLLRLGATLHSSGSLGEPLQAAAMRGHESITRTLLSHGADVNGKGGLHGTALQAATHRGHHKVVEILLDAGADVHRPGLSRDAFYAASEGGHEGIVRLLLERGYKLQHDLPGPMERMRMRIPGSYKSLLRAASPGRARETISAQDHQLRSKEWRERASVVNFSHVVDKIRGAVTSELEPMVPYRQGSLEVRHAKEHFGFRAAAAKGHITVVELLLSHLDKLDISSEEIVAAFKEACENGHEKVVSKLLSDRVELENLNAALEAAALNGHLTVVNLLIDHEDRLRFAFQSPTQVRRFTHLVSARGCC